MKLLKEILNGVNLIEVLGSTDIMISDIFFDTKHVKENSIFVAVKGYKNDGHEFISKAVQNGASTIICQKFPTNIHKDITYIRVIDTSIALGVISSSYYENPSKKIKLVGITGTNGKTTTASLLHNYYQSNKKKSGLISTIVNKIGDANYNTTHTTPDVLTINKLLSRMIKENCEYCFMEVSSHAISQNRIFGLQFDISVFTNISHDHLDYHETFDNYILAKKKLFDMLSSDSFALINNDDNHAKTMIHHSKAKIKTFSLKSIADFKGRILERSIDGMLINVDGSEVWTKLVGDFNAYNILVVYSIAILLGGKKIDVLTKLSELKPIEGRFQLVKSENGIVGIVDYAHTPDALKNILDSINSIRDLKKQLITVVGCGGDRDKEKRPKMARIACEFSDKIIFTSDNPRSEDPEIILQEMNNGINSMSFSNHITITKRKEAIKTAVLMANSGDIILVAGKGHEKYQEINGTKHQFDDLQELKNTFKLINK